MTRYRSLFACLGLLALAAACSRMVPHTGGDDINAVKSVEDAWVKDIATKDADKIANYFADDGSQF